MVHPYSGAEFPGVVRLSSLSVGVGEMNAQPTSQFGGTLFPLGPVSILTKNTLVTVSGVVATGHGPQLPAKKKNTQLSTLLQTWAQPRVYQA